MRYAAVGAVMASLTAWVGAAIHYSVSELPSLAGASRAWGVNGQNQTVGVSLDAAGVGRGVLWDGGVHSIANASGSLSDALGINDAGVIVGSGRANNVTGAYSYNAGVWTNLGNLGGNGAGQGKAISNSGRIAGWSANRFGTNRAFVWNGQMQDLGTFGGPRAEANAINEAGDAAGFAEDSGGNANAFYWHAGAMTNIGLLFPSPSYAHGMNDLGDVVGEGRVSASSSSYSAFIWNNGSLSVLAGLGGNNSVLNDINNSRWGAGISQRADGQNRAVLYTPGTGLIDLNNLVQPGSGLTLVEAWSINEGGSIVGLARNSQGKDAAFLAVVVPAPPVAVLALPAAAVAGMRRRR